MTGRLELKRRWWYPLFVEVWEDVGTGRDWKRGPYTMQRRRGYFVRRRKAEEFARWLAEEPEHG